MKRDGDSLQDGERRVESRESAVNPARAIITGDHSAFHARTLMARIRAASWVRPCPARQVSGARLRSEEHTSELQSLMRISYAVFCLKKKKKKTTIINST